MQPYDPNHPLAPPPPPSSSFPPPPGYANSLGDGRLPADLGLSGLGLVMQLAGTVFSGIAGVMGVMMVIMMVQLSSLRGGGPNGGEVMFMLAAVAASFARSAMHRAAGTRLIFDGPGTPLSGIRKYLVAAAIQTVLICGYLASKGAPSEMTTMLLLVLGAWPLTLFIIFSLPKYKQADQGLPLSEDKGFEGAGILMLLLGLTGLGFGLVMLYSFLQMPGQLLSTLPGMIMLLITIMLVIRSGLHVRAGWNGVNEANMDRCVEDAAKYANFAVITAFVTAGGFLLILMSAGGGMAGAGMQVFLMISMFLVLLLAWPLIIRKFFAERQFADMMVHSDGMPRFQRAPDLGHTTLGWFLVALGVYQLAVSLSMAAILPDTRGFTGRGDPTDPFSMMFSMMQSGGMHSPWWTVGAAGLQLWAGLELIRMTDNHRIVASIYGVVATAVAVYVNLPSLDTIKKQGMASILGGGGIPGMGFATIAISLIIPIGTLILVNRTAARGR